MMENQFSFKIKGKNCFPYLSCTLLSLHSYFPFHFLFISSFFLHETKQHKINLEIVFSIVNYFPSKLFYTENILRPTKQSRSVVLKILTLGSVLPSLFSVQFSSAPISSVQFSSNQFSSVQLHSFITILLNMRIIMLV